MEVTTSLSETKQNGFRESIKSTTGTMKPLNNLQTSIANTSNEKDERGVQVAEIMKQMLEGAFAEDI